MLLRGIQQLAASVDTILIATGEYGVPDQKFECGEISQKFKCIFTYHI